MATVDIEPASLAVTPGESQVLTLTITNDGDDVEAYHLTAVDDAAGYVTIAPDTLLVHPGETASAAATLTLENTGKWRVGDLIVRFHIVPAGRPDDFLVVEAIVTIQSFSDVAAVLSQPALEARLNAAAEITVANAGNAHTYAEVSVSGGDVSLSIRESHVSLPAGSAENVHLRVRPRSMLWRGAPIQHPFVVTVSPEGGQAISLEGTFTQLPILPRWGPAAAIALGAVAVVALLVWLIGPLALGGAGETPAESESASTTESASSAPPEPDVRMAIEYAGAGEVKAGDDVAVNLEPDVDGAPADSLLAMEVEWPEELSLAESDCEAWTAPRGESVLQGRPRPGDECIVNTSGAGSDALLTFATPPEAVAGAVSVGATRLVTLDDGDVTTLETGPGSEFGEDSVPLELTPYPFWMEVRDRGPASEPWNARVTVHRDVRGDDADQRSRMSFDVGLPSFVNGVLNSTCDRRESTTCTVIFSSDPADEEYTTKVIDLQLDVDEGGGIGPITVTGASVDDVAPQEVDQWVRGAEALLVSESLFGVNVRLDADEQPGEGGTVTATIDVSGVELPAEVETYTGGSWLLALALDWPEGLEPVEPADGCTLVDNVCTLPPLDHGEDAQVTIEFDVDDSVDEGRIRARGGTLSYDPTTADDRSDGRTQPAVTLLPHWIGSDTETFRF
jgi:hypothetical protein